MRDTAENGAPCTPECEAHKNGRSWPLSCPQTRVTPPADTQQSDA